MRAFSFIITTKNAYYLISEFYVKGEFVIYLYDIKDVHALSDSNKS